MDRKAAFGAGSGIGLEKQFNFRDMPSGQMMQDINLTWFTLCDLR